MPEFWVQSLRSLLEGPDRNGDVIAPDAVISSSVACAACGDPIVIDELVLVSVADLADGKTVLYHERCSP